MMEISINEEIHEIKDQVHVIDKNVTKLTILVETLIEESKEQKEKISRLQRFKNKMVGIFLSTNTLMILIIPVLIALL
jgi:hypothetical protein